MNGIFVGRLCPIHIGHEMVIKKMIEECGGEENCLVIIGSSNSPLSLRHFFSYEERREFLKKIFQGIRVVGLPDYPGDDKGWLVALDDILSLAKIAPQEAIFFGGCEEDVSFFIEAGRQIQILNRFDGSTPKISATEVRDCLIQVRSLDGLLNPAIAEFVQSKFRQKWELFKRI
ncbi:MAG: hypothetical protein V1770_04725 [bacterium]